MSQNDSLLLVVATGIAIVGLCSVPAAASLVLRLTKKEKNDGAIYEDADGKATPESMNAFSATPAKVMVLLFAAVGTALSVVLPVCSHRGQSFVTEDWMSMAAWVCSPATIKRAGHLTGVPDCYFVSGDCNRLEQEISASL